MAYGRPAQERRCKFGVAILILSVFTLIVGLGCGRQPGDSPTSVSQQPLPFHSTGSTEADVPRPVLPEDVKSTTTVPFQSSSHSRMLAAGTLLTVRLSNSLSAAEAHAGDSFTAIVADPLLVEGDVLVDRGTPVIGRIESAKLETTSNPPLGYLRLTLNGITLSGRSVTLHTTSLFARATQESSTGSLNPARIQLKNGRRLTFRLTSPVALNETTQTAHLQKLNSTE
jgi:hypothetical protein